MLSFNYSAGWISWLYRRIHNPQVASSNLAPATWQHLPKVFEATEALKFGKNKLFIKFKI